MQKGHCGAMSGSPSPSRGFALDVCSPNKFDGYDHSSVTVVIQKPIPKKNHAGFNHICEHFLKKFCFAIFISNPQM
jgi:hypothetical protein